MREAMSSRAGCREGIHSSMSVSSLSGLLKRSYQTNLSSTEVLRVGATCSAKIRL